MALKRLDEEFELKPGTQLLPYMKRLLPGLEGRFQSLEATATIYARVLEDIRAAALLRMNEILIPATEDILAVTKLGFLLAPVSTPYTLVLGYMTMFVDEGPQRDSFTPSPYLLIEVDINTYAIARLIGYHQEDGLLEMEVTAIHGSPGPHNFFMVSSTPGMADSTKLYHDAIAPMHTEVAADYTEIVVMHEEILQAYNDLAESGLDLTAYVRRDGTRPFTGVQAGITPVAGSNDATLATTAWARARDIEYSAPKFDKTGGTITGAVTIAGGPTSTFTLAATPSNPMHAATKAYVDQATPYATAAEFLSNTGGAKALSPGVVWTAAGPVALAPATVQTPNFATAIDFIWTLSAAGSTLNNPTNAKPGQKGFLYIVQDGGGSKNITGWGTAWRFPGGTKPTFTPAANAVDVIGYAVANATTIYCTFLPDFK